MKYKTKIKINGAELTDEQSSSASSITGVSLEASAGNGFQVGNSAASALSVTILKPYKTSFDGDKVEFYILPDGEDDESLAEKIEEEVGSAEETEHVEDNDETDDIETEEVYDGEGEEITEEEEAEAEAEDDIEESNLFDTMNGEEVTGDVTEEEAVQDPADWELFGVFYVYKQTNNRDGSITLRCYDGFQLLHGDYVPAIKSGTIQQFYDDIRTQCAEFGVTVDPEEFAEEENVTITWNQVCSFRQAIGYISGLVGGYATFGDDDTLGIDYYAYNDRVLLLPELLDYKTTSAGETQIDGVVCTVNLRGDTVESGDGGQSITFYNPFATQQTVDSILEQYQGIRYIGANVKAKWDPSVRCGDLVRVMSEAEYRNYIAMGNAFRNSGDMTAAEVLNLKKELNAVGRTILVSSQRIDFGGETLTEITSHLPTEAEKANAPTSPNDAKFRIVTAELIKTNELVAEKATIKDLEATNAEIKNIKSDYVNTATLEAEAAKIAKAEIENATIKNAQIESINGNKIVNGSIVAAALSSEVIKNFANNNIYYQATEPTGDIKEGDLWFKTLTATSGDRAGVLFVWSGGTWQNKKFDSESILAKSITAGEIASGTITAGEVDMDNLQTNLARIGDTAGKNVQITGTGVDIKDGEKTLASYGATSTIGATAGNHVTIADDGVQIRNGQKVVASYGETIVLGAEGEQRLEITKNGVVAKNEQNTLAKFTSNGMQIGDLSGNNMEIKDNKVSIRSGVKETLAIESATTSHSVTTTYVFHGSEADSAMTAGEIYTESHILSNPVKINSVEITDESGRAKAYGGFYDVSIDGSQLVITIDASNSGASYTDWTEYTKCIVTYESGTVESTVKCNNFEGNVVNCKELIAQDQNGDALSFTKFMSGTGTATANTGSVYMLNWTRCGTLATVELGVKATGAVAAGKNISDGKVAGIPKPVTSARGTGAYSVNAILCGIGVTGSYWVRNCGTGSIESGKTAIVGCTYMTDGTML